MGIFPGIIRWLRCPSWGPFPANIDPEDTRFAPAPSHCPPLPAGHAFATKPSLQEPPLGSELESRAPGQAEGPGIPSKWARQDQTVHSEVHLSGGYSFPSQKLASLTVRSTPRPFPNYLGSEKDQDPRSSFFYFLCLLAVTSVLRQLRQRRCGGLEVGQPDK